MNVYANPLTLQAEPFFFGVLHMVFINLKEIDEFQTKQSVGQSPHADTALV